MTGNPTSPRVVVGVDGSPGSLEALRWAVDYAKASGASLTLLTSWHWPTSYGVPVFVDEWDPRIDAKRLLGDALETVDLPPDRVETKVVDGFAGNVLVAASENADLLVVGCRGHGGLVGTLLGSVSAYCVHHAHCPVVVVR